MNVYIFPSIELLTSNYHSGGGLVVVATSIHRALELARADGVEFSSEEIESVEIYPIKGKASEKVHIFPDAGCC